MVVLAHNLAAINTQRQIGINTKKQGKSTEKLSSGYKINRAADGAAGLAISEKMRRQVRGLHQASENIQDGVSYAQTADGALEEVHDMLHRINELSVQAANDTNSSSDRVAINQEVQELKDEINRIFTTTTFNEKKIWQGEWKAHAVAVGTTDYTAITLPSTNDSSTITNTNKEAFPRNSYRLSADESGIVVKWTGYNGTEYESNKIAWGARDGSTHTFELKDYVDLTTYPELEGVNMSYSYSTHPHATMDDLISAVNNDVVHSYVSTSEYVQQYNNGSTQVSFSTSINYDSLLISEKDFEAEDTVFAEGINNYQNITVNPTANGKNAEAWEFKFNFKNIGTVKAVAYDTDYYSYDQDADKEGIWWRWREYSDGSRYKSAIIYDTNSKCKDGSLDAINDALVNSTAHNLQNGSRSGGTIRIFFNLTAENDIKRIDGEPLWNNRIGSLTMNISVGPNDTPDTIKAALSNLTGIDIYDNANPSKADAYTYLDKMGIVTETTYNIETKYDRNIKIGIQAGQDAKDNMSIHYEALDLNALGMLDTNVLTEDNAKRAITQVDDALKIVSAQRSLFGAYQNRMEHAISVDKISEENTQASESRIRDTEMDKEIVRHSLDNLLVQTGQAMLAQANQNSTGILNLLNA